MTTALPTEATHPKNKLPCRLTRRSLLLGTAVALALVPGCGLELGPGPPRIPPNAGPTTVSTPSPSRIFGVIPIPPAPSATPTPEPIVLVFGHWETGAARAVLDQAARAFEQITPGVVVRTDPLPFQAHFDRLQSGATAGSAPDVFVDSGAFFYSHAASHRLLDLSARFTAANLKLADYWTDPVTRPRNGQQLSLPLWTDTEIVFVNRDQIAKIRAAPPAGSWTWGDLLGLAQHLTVGKPGETTHWGLLVVNDLVGGWGSFATSNGGSWLDVATHKTALDPATVEALHWIRDAMLVHHVAPRPIEQQSLSQGGTVDPFLSGAVSLFPSGSWELTSALQSASFGWDIVPLPRAPRTAQSISPASVQPVGAFSETAHADPAWQFLRFLISSDAQRLWNNAKLRIPALKASSAEYASPPPANASAAVTALNNAADFRFTVNWLPFRSALLTPLDDAFNGLTDLDVAIAKAAQAGDAALGS